MALATALATALAYFPYRLLDGTSERKAVELRLQNERTISQTLRLRAENQRLRRQIEALEGDESAIEDIAREELGMVRPSEVIIRIERAAPRDADARAK